jgi:DNA polymerase-4
VDKHGEYWSRAIILIDMNAFFCSVEQIDHPEWQGKPIGITNGSQGTCIITCSYEARSYGIRTGMRLKTALQLCPDFIRVPSHPKRYAEVSSNIMSALTGLTPKVEVYSVDEAFLDVTACQNLLGPAEHIAKRVQQIVREVSGGVLCSVGLSGDKTTAKYAAKLNKPNGLTVIHPDTARTRLQSVPLTELWGIGRGIGTFLSERGVHTCGDMQKLPIGVLAKRFGNPGRRLWFMAQGLDPSPIEPNVPPPKSIGHGKVMPPDTRDPQVIRTFLLHMTEKVAARLRRHQLCATRFYVGLRTQSDWLHSSYDCLPASDDGRIIRGFCEHFLTHHWQGQGVHQVQVTAMRLQEKSQQLELFTTSGKQEQLHRAIDAINQRYGEFTVAPARLLGRSKMPNVIAPAWKPSGHRETVLE